MAKDSYLQRRKLVRKRFKSVLTAFKDLYYYGCEVDKWLPEVMLLPFITLQWKLNPTWYRIIAPPGSGKTVHLSYLHEYEKAFCVDEFTPKSFVSGFRGAGGDDPSKIPQFNGKVLIIADESTFMEQRSDDRNAIQAILRRSFDGTISKGFGNMKEVQTYKSRFNVLVASTPQIDRYFVYNTALGERYVNYRLQIPNRLLLVERAYENQFRKQQASYKRLSADVHRYLRKMPRIGINDIEISKRAKKCIIECADFVARTRTRVTRDVTGRYITTLPQVETAGRLVSQMTQTALANAALHGSGEVEDTHLEKATYMGLCSITAVSTFVLHNAWLYHKWCIVANKSTWFSIQTIVGRTALGRASVAKILEDLAIHRILDTRAGAKQGGRLIEYRISKHTIRTVKTIKLFKHYKPPTDKIINKKRKDRQRN